MKLYNSLSNQIEEYAPQAGRASIYVCGITPYDTTHLGHAFTYHTFDLLIRYLESQGISVNYTQNVTDIDDDILRKAKEVGSDWYTLGSQWTAHFIRDLTALNVRPPEHYPRATDVIPEIVETNQKLIEKGFAYTRNGNVYFDVDSFERFGALSKIPRGDMLAVANQRGNRPADPNKADPLDFVLWQARAEGEPSWPSPWGEGRPGWHIECTAMNRRYLGDAIDIHGGGGDLLFPHHECEIAQAEAATGVAPFVRVWMHVAMVRMNGEKMSKSLGNLVMVSNLLKTYTPDAIRLYLTTHHYRDSWEWHAGEMDAAAQMAARWSEAVSGPFDVTAPRVKPTVDAVLAALADDLDTPKAVAALERLSENIRSGRYTRQGLDSARATLRDMAALLGMRLGAAGVEPRVSEGWGRHLQRFVVKNASSY